MRDDLSFLQRWGIAPLGVYIAGILMPALVASQRPELMPAIGVAAFTVLFWLGPFVSAATPFWTKWPAGWRLVWILLIPVLAAPTFLPFMS